MIRKYKKSDNIHLHNMLIKENWNDNRKLYEIYPTYIMEENNEVVGFITMKEAHTLPAMIHGCIRKDKRDGQRWKEFLKLLQYIAKSKNKKAILIHAPKERVYIKKFIENLPNIKLYSEDKKCWYYIMEVI